MYSEKDKLRRFAQAIAIPLSVSDTVKWPIRAGRAIKPVRKEFALQYANEIEKGIEKYGNYLWKKAFQNPTQIWRVSHHLINGWQEAGISRNEIAKKICLLMKGISLLSNGNDFVPIGKHQLYKEIPIMNERLNENKNILRLGAVLWSYCETLYFVAREIGCEYHGPYTYDGRVMLERNFKALFPLDLWGCLSLFENVSEITIYTFHNKTLEVSFDVYNNLLVDKGDLFGSFCGGKVLVNGKEADDNKIEKLICMAAKEMQKLCKLIQSLDTQSIIWQYVRIFWYRKQELAKAIGENWEPDTRYKLKYQNMDSMKKKELSDRSSVEDLTQKYDFSEDY